jgi:hypothetical protein
MQDMDLVFVRLRLAERLTHERFARLSGICDFEVLKADQNQWNEATTALLVYERSAVIIAMSGGRLSGAT